jgi:hypothetical protein
VPGFDHTGGKKLGEGQVKMLQNSTWTLNQLQVRDQESAANSSLLRMAAARYRQARFRAWIGQLGARLLGRERNLLHLGSLDLYAVPSSGRYAGLQPVPIGHIRGSEGRSGDFDAEFRPLKAHSRWRWVNMAAAKMRGVALPPVELIQVGDVYFVRDGHHRISVARDFGQEQIDAEVTVWDLNGPLPWEPEVLGVQMACLAT